MVVSVLTGLRGPIRFDYGLYLSNVRGEELTFLRTISGTVDMSNFRNEAWQLQLKMPATDALNPLSDYVLVTIKATAGGYSEYYPFGLYRFRVPQADLLEGRAEWDLTGYSLEMLVADDEFEAGYEAEPGAGCLAEAKQILIDQGIPADRIDFPPDSEDETLEKGLVVDVFGGEEDGSKLKIVNALLNAGNFYSLSVHADGRLTTRPQDDLAQQEPDFIYGPGGDPMVLPPVVNSWDNDERFANRVIVRVTDTKFDPPLYAVAENHRPNSIGSIENLSRVVTETISRETVANQNALNRYARGQLQSFSGFRRNVTLALKPDPRRGVLEIGELRGIGDLSTPDMPLGTIDDIYRVNNLSWNLDPGQAQPMQMELSKVDEV